MPALRLLVLGVSWAVLGVALARPAFGAERGCVQVALAVDAEVLARFPHLPERVEGALLARKDIEPCARVWLGATGAGLAVRVVLEDGRSAVRRVPAPEDVIPALEGLLLVPSPEAARATQAEPSARPARAVPSPAPARGVRTGVSESDGPEQAPPEGAERMGFSLSLVGGAHRGDGQSGESYGLLSLVNVSRWLFGLDGRAVNHRAFGPSPEGEPRTTLRVAAVSGRRLGAGTLALDLLLGPALVLEHSTEIEVEEGRTTRRASATQVVPRLWLGSHLHLGALSAVSGFVGIEGEVGPTGAPSPEGFAGLGPLPVWSAGLALGGTVRTR